MYERIDMHSKYDNIHKNEMFYANIYINNHIIKFTNCMISGIKSHTILFDRVVC